MLVLVARGRAFWLPSWSRPTTPSLAPSQSTRACRPGRALLCSALRLHADAWRILAYFSEPSAGHSRKDKEKPHYGDHVWPPGHHGDLPDGRRAVYLWQPRHDGTGVCRYVAGLPTDP